MTGSTNKKPLPKNWQDILMSFDKPVPRSTIAKKFGVSATVIYRWQERDKEFNSVCVKVLKVPHKRVKSAPPILNMTPDDIDALLYHLLDVPNERNNKQARIAIRQLRRERRELLSEINRLKHAEHVRKTRTNSTHANGGANGSRAGQGLAASL